MSALEWYEADLSFAGWVPCITGQLSFSLIGSAPKAVRLNREILTGRIDAPERVVFVMEKRHSGDLPLPKGAAELIAPCSSADFLMMAQTIPANRPIPDEPDKIFEDRMGALVGEVIAIAHAEGRPKGRLRKAIAKIRKRISGAHRSSHVAISQEEINTLRTKVEAQLSGIAETPPLVRAKFALFRTGEVRVWLRTEDLPLVLEEKGQPARDMADVMRAHTDGDESAAVQAREFGAGLCRQVYYFVKDAAHRHYHHDADRDAILPLMPASNIDDESWRRETLWALARAVLADRQKRELWSYRDALGILAYAEAFQRSLSGIQRRPSTFGEFQQLAMASYDFQATRLSIEAKRDELESERSADQQFWAVMAAAALAAGALWVAAVQISPQICATLSTMPLRGAGAASSCPAAMSPPIAQALAWFVQTPSQALALAVLMGIAYFQYFGRGFHSIRPVRRFFRQAQMFVVHVGVTVAKRVVRLAPAYGDYMVQKTMAVSFAALAVVIALLVTRLLLFLASGR